MVTEIKPLPTVVYGRPLCTGWRKNNALLYAICIRKGRSPMIRRGKRVCDQYWAGLHRRKKRIRNFNPFVDVTITSRVVCGETVRPEMRRKSALKFAINWLQWRVCTYTNIDNNILICYLGLENNVGLEWRYDDASMRSSRPSEYDNYFIGWQNNNKKYYDVFFFFNNIFIEPSIKKIGR